MKTKKVGRLIGIVVALIIGSGIGSQCLACEDQLKKLTEVERKPYLMGRMAGYVGLSLLGSTKIDSQNILALTNAGYARLNGDTTALALEGFSWITETSIGRGNLIRIQSPRNSTLWFALFNRETGDLVYLEAPKALSEEIHEKIFRTRKENISLKKLQGDPAGWDLKLKERPFGGREFSITTIANQWASGAPFELLQLASFHDHLCPGVTMGYLMAGYLDRHLPLDSGERYYFISLAPSCQDDAFQVLYNATVGKRSMTVIPLALDQKAQWTSGAKNISGLYIAWNEKTEKGRGMALAIDWEALKTRREGLGWLWRLQMNQELLPILHEPEKVIQKITQFDLPFGKTPYDLISIEMKSLKGTGITRE